MEFKLWLEGRFDWETTQISRSIISALKNNISTIRERGEISFYHGNINTNLPKLNLDGNFPNILVNFRKGNYIFTSGSYRPSLNQITINIESPINQSQWLNGFNDLIYRIKNTIRHELEHSGQDSQLLKDAGGKSIFAQRIKDKKTKRYSKEDIEDILYYYTDPAEVAAHVSGLYKQSKTSKIKFDNLLDNYLYHVQKTIFKNVETKAIKNLMHQIRKQWTEYANTRFPHLNN